MEEQARGYELRLQREPEGIRRRCRVSILNAGQQRILKGRYLEKLAALNPNQMECS